MDNNTSFQNTNEVIDNNLVDLKELLTIFKRRKKVIIISSALLFVLSTIILGFRRITNPQYLGTFSILIKDPILEKTRRGGEADFFSDLATNTTYTDIPTLVQYLRSETVIARTAKLNDLTPVGLRNQIRISVPRNEDVIIYLPNILKVDVIGSDKLKLSKIINDLSSDYIKIAADTQKEKLIVGINFLDNEKPSLEKRASKLQDQLEKFRLENKLINPIQQSSILTELINQTKNKILLLESENVRLLFIKENLSDGIIFTKGIQNQSDNSGLGIIGAEQLLLREILEVKSSLAKAQSTYKKTSTFVLNLQAKLDQLEPILLENQKSAVDAAIIVVEGKIKSAKNELIDLEKQFSYLPKLINDYSEIVSKQKLIEKNLEYLLSAREKLELELSQGTLPWKLMSRPYVNPSPFKPNITKNLLYGLLASLSLGLLIGLIRDKVDNVFHTIDEIKKDKNLPPLLGFIPFFKFSSINNKKDSKGFLTINNFIESSTEEKELNFVFEETFRNIYTSIKFSKTDKDIKTIAITSSVPSEGKSLSSVLLALNISEIDRKVLIIDADLRRPSLHKKFEVDNVAGLTNILVDNNFKWQDAINQFKKYKNLYYMTGGKTPPNPIKLLNSQRMRNLIKEISNSNEFDLIIFDCPPIVGLSDALIISNFVDGVILTISLNNVNQQIVKDSLQKLTTSTTEILGSVANNIKEITNISQSNRKYYYQYQYNYQNTYFPSENEKVNSNNELTDEEVMQTDIKINLLSTTLKKLRNLKQTIFDWINE